LASVVVNWVGYEAPGRDATSSSVSRVTGGAGRGAVVRDHGPSVGCVRTGKLSVIPDINV
jgi:hypothetical protein